jgi:uncharacterized protein
MLDTELIEILACPETKQPVHLAELDLVQRVNAAISAGTLKNREGGDVREPIDAGLVREDGQYLYAVRDDIPVMLVGEGIPLDRV